MQYLALFESVAYSCRALLYIRQRVLLNHFRLFEITDTKLIALVSWLLRNELHQVITTDFVLVMASRPTIDVDNDDTSAIVNDNSTSV